MAFADHLSVDGRLLWWGVEVSDDNFATIDYRWATHSGDVEGSFFEERLISIGTIQRGLGSGHLPVASSTTIAVDNTDFGADWLNDRATVVSYLFKARFRIKCGLGTPGDGVAVLTQKVGTFACLDFPKRADGIIQLSLADDSLGSMSDILVPPTFRDWFEDAGTTTSNSPFGSVSFDPRMIMDYDLPMNLQFGRGPFDYCFPACTFIVDRSSGGAADFGVAEGFAAGHRKYIYPIMVCATLSASAVATTDVIRLEGIYREDVLTDHYSKAQKGPLDIPKTVIGPGGVTQTIWAPYKTETLTKDGNSWKILWVAFDVIAYMAWLLGIASPASLANTKPLLPSSPDYPPAQIMLAGNAPTATTWPWNDTATYFAAFDRFVAYGSPMSGITGNTTQYGAENPVNILQDLVGSYSELGSGNVDTTRFARALLVTNMVAAGGVFFFNTKRQTDGLNGSPSAYGIGVLRQTLADVASSCDVDVFLTMDGKAAVVTQGADFETQTTTFPTIDEERINGVSDYIPSQGERWSPYNRIMLRAGGGKLVGPYDAPDGGVASWGRVLTRVIDTKWWWNFNHLNGGAESLYSNIWNRRNVESVVRPIISFTTDIGVLALEIGDYFRMSWTRGGENSVYDESLWRLESVAILPETGAVNVTAVWMDDMLDYQPFLFDNETLIVRSAPAFGQTLTVTDGSADVDRSAGSFITDAVAAGDIVRMRDTSEAATTFFRNRDIRVLSVTSATRIVVDGDLDFGTAGAHVIADTDWKIVRGATTYHTAVSDPANYPSGGDMYGKATDSAGDFTNATPGNRLLDG